jgi:hypothetical protein
VHLDAPLAKWTLDVCIDQSAPWPIHLSQVIPWPEQQAYNQPNWADAITSDPSLNFESLSLEPGKALVFSGSSQWHYRDRIPRKGNDAYCHLVFFHFVPSGTRSTLKVEDWPRLFDCEQLAQIEFAS